MYPLIYPFMYPLIPSSYFLLPKPPQITQTKPDCSLYYDLGHFRLSILLFNLSPLETFKNQGPI